MNYPDDKEQIVETVYIYLYKKDFNNIERFETYSVLLGQEGEKLVVPIDWIAAEQLSNNASNVPS